MSILGFLKKDKLNSSQTLELPPIPNLDEDISPNTQSFELPPLPDFNLSATQGPAMQPLPAKPAQQLPELPVIPELPTRQEVPTRQEFVPPAMPTEAPRAENPKQVFPEAHHEEVIPDKIPPLEELEPAPAYDYSPKDYSPRPMEEQPVEQTVIRPMPRDEKKGPLYVRSDRFKSMLDAIEQSRIKFGAEEDIFARLNEAKNLHDQKFEEFKQKLEDVQRKLLFIDRSLFENR